MKIVGIVDRHGGVIKQEGFTFKEVRDFYLNRNGNQLEAPFLIPLEKISEEIWEVEAEIFIPAAASRLVQKSQVESLIEKGLEVISCGANVPFADKEIFYGPISEFADSNVTVIPDFIANCGMARVFRYLMNDDVSITDEAIFKDVSDCIGTAMNEVYELQSDKNGFAAAALECSISKLV